jgi:class 3 adenylate cyclase/tetratricopeptide (TPR) repeat protein
VLVVSTCPTCHAPTTPGSRYCSQCGHALSQADPLEGERKVATVLFADVAGSTALAESLDPEDWAAVMNGAFSFMNAAVSRYGGTVGRLMGDAVLAFFGAPIAHEDHAERAVRTALEIRDAAQAYSATLRERYGIEFGVRVGVSTGTAVLAVLGDSVRAEYTAMGDTANTAARLQGAARPGTVLISRDTQELVRGQFALKSQGAVSLKGKRDAVEAFEVLSARSQPTKVRGIEGVWSPLVGRETEMDALRERVGALREGRGGVVAVVGEAGLGKSRLVAELREQVAGAPGLVWFEGRSLSYGQALPYHPWKQIGRQFIQAEPEDGPEIVRDKLARFVERMGLPRDHLPFYETMMSVESEESLEALAQYQGEARVAAAADAVIAAVRAGMTAGGQPTSCLLVFDDLHWADRASMELVARTAALSASHPLLVVCVLRPDRKAGSWTLMDRLREECGDAFLRIELQPLSGASAAELLTNLVRRDDLPPRFRSKILARSDGNPFFLEEVLRAQIDGGNLVREGDRLRATEELDSVSIPHTLAAVLAARIDQLPEATKRVAQSASVIGRIFPFAALERVCRDAPPPERIDDIQPHLDILLAEEILRERSAGSAREYIFKHALTCEAAYDLLLRHRRRQLHDRAARALEELYPDRLDELAPVLAHHFHEAGQADRTAQYSLLAADRALRLFAVEEAVAHYDRAYHDLGPLDEPPAPELIDAIMGWVATRYKLNTYDGAIERLERAEEVARSSGDRQRLARVLSWMGTVHVVTGRPSRAAPYLFESNELATELGDEVLSIAPFFYASDAMVDHDPRGAAERLGQVVELSQKHGMPEIEGHALAAKAVAHARMGEFDLAEETIARALAVAESGGHRVKEADVHIFVAAAYYDLGDVSKGLEHARIGARLAQEENAVECACAAFYGVGMGNLEQQDLEEALSSFGVSKRLADTSGWRGYVNRIRGGTAAAELERGSEEALEELTTALENARAERDHYASGVLAHRLARIHLERGAPERAEPLLDAALKYYRSAEMRPYEARALTLLARIRDAQGRPGEAEEARRAAAALRAGFRQRPVDPSVSPPNAATTATATSN